ncbi:MAG: hypothetical protein J6K72_05875 [Clostridia bacterium]|nr:hypothetical protein [Clostridia bacterium]
MRKLISFLLVLFFLLPCSFTLAEASSSILEGEWYFSDGDPQLIYSLIFNEDGTGKFCAPRTNYAIRSWRLEENFVVFEYFTSDEWRIVETMYTLIQEDGEYYILFSAADGTTRKYYRIDSSSVAGSWYCDDGNSRLIHTLVFHEDGTGSAIAASQTIDILSWTTEETKILFDYVYNGTFTTNDMYCLSVENGESVIRFVDGNHQRIFRRIDATESAPDASVKIEDVTGTWTCRMADSVVTLTLNPDGSGALVIGNSTYSCAWRRSGPSFILYQNDIAIEGVYSGTTISLNLGGQILEFTR